MQEEKLMQEEKSNDPQMTKPGGPAWAALLGFQSVSSV
jgi:hypothetical protein